MILNAYIIERVARAICESMEADDFDGLSETGIIKAAYRQQAHAAIEEYFSAVNDGEFNDGRFAALASVPAPSGAERIAEFAKAILHGDDEHRAWLTEAADAFIASQPLPAPRGKETGPLATQFNISKRSVGRILLGKAYADVR